MAYEVDYERFPHMMENDIALWKRFLALHKSEFLYFEYDVHVGVGVPVPPETDPRYKLAMEASSQKRIDVIAHSGRLIYVIEVKPYASLSAIGQVLSYVALYKEKFPVILPVFPCIVTDIIYPDEAWLFRNFGIVAYAVQPQ